MKRKKPPSKQSKNTSKSVGFLRLFQGISDDQLFFIHIVWAIILVCSIYSEKLMGPFGQLVYQTGYRLFSDALPLLPWAMLFTGASLLTNRGQHKGAYMVSASVFMTAFMMLMNSFFLDRMILIHGKIIWSFSESLFKAGAGVFGVFGMRLLSLSIAGVTAMGLFNVSLRMWRPLNIDLKQIIKAFRQVKYALFYKKCIRYNRSFHQKMVKEKAPRSVLKAINNHQKVADVVVTNSHTNQPIETINIEPKPMKKPVADGYELPPLTVLEKAQKINSKQIEEDMKKKSKVLELTLSSFNVEATVVNITIGPSVSRFELQPGTGVKISKITNLTQDIALQLAVPMVRIEAPIPGKALIGIEVPNVDISPLNLRSIIHPNTFYDSSKPLDCILGQRITGEPVTMDLNKMPHILVAGSTGSGKSVCINAIILSILMKATPDEVKFLMIDPKKVELSLYSDIPHLLAPVVTNPNKAAATLKQWALAEMERRYELFTEHGVKDLAGFNALASANPEGDITPIPCIVVIIDEFADLMMVASQDVENTICRLAQMARATGIHLVIATQRPSVNVVTGLIKANVPSRISFAVQSQIDSRTVLDMAGAEKLLGKGDMLYMPVGASKPDRVQGVFVSEKEVNAVVNFIKGQATPDYVDAIIEVEPLVNDKKDASHSEGATDELFERAKALIQSTQYASTSYLQRKLRIGYNRAARLMDELEDAGIISAYDGDSKTRSVLSN